LNPPRLAVVDLRDHHVLGPFQFRAREGYAGIAARLAEECAVGLRVLVVVVAANFVLA
jgi:hypothetical protein